MFMLDNLIKDIQTIVNSVIIKYDKDAKVMETLDVIRESDAFISASLQQDSFISYISFDTDLIMEAGINDPLVAQSYHDNKNLIPVNLRNTILIKQRERIIELYNEKNNYYRMLNGLPDIDDINLLYADSTICINNNIEPNIPIHLYNVDDTYTLIYLGEVDRLIALNPTKKYLSFLGPDKIDIVQARTAKNFTILKMTTDINDTLYMKFNELYDNFIAMMIMVMTIQRVAVNVFKNGIERDFYDLDSIKTLLEVYKIPFISDLPIEYQRSLLRNLNNLLKYKSTDKVLYDICSIMGFERMKIFKYFLVKEHLMDENGNPLFLFKTIDDGSGGTITVEDKENMYQFYFQRIDLSEKNNAVALTDSTMHLDYTDVTITDPYWWEDDDLKNSLLEEEFNFIESKYMNMNLMYNLSEMLFEIIYIFRFIIDKKNSIDLITVDLPNIFINKPIKLFNVIVLLCALMAKRDHMAGNILIDPSKILSIFGFNFAADFKLIKDSIRNNPNLYDQELLTYFENMNVISPSDINNLFTKIKDLNSFLINKISTSTTIEEYRVYKDLFNTLMISEESSILFQKSDGTPALTFKDYFSDHDPVIYDFIENADIDKLSGYIDYIIYNVNELITDLKYIKFINDTNNPIVNAIITLINFFKSYTINLADMNILYVMNSRVYNSITLIADINIITKNFAMNESLPIIDYVTTNKSLVPIEIFKLLELINSVMCSIDTQININTLNSINSITSNMDIFNNILPIMDFIITNKILLLKDKNEYLCIIKKLISLITIHETVNSMNKITEMSLNMSLTDIGPIIDYILSNAAMLNKDSVVIQDSIQLIHEV